MGGAARGGTATARQADVAFPGWPTVVRRLDAYGLSPHEAAALKRQAESFLALRQSMRDAVGLKPIKPPKPVKATRVWTPTAPKEKKPRVEWFASGPRRPCPFKCHTMLPHVDPKAIRKHMLRVRYQDAIERRTRWGRANAAFINRLSVRAIREPRVQAFREIAPHAYAALGHERVHEIVASFPKHQRREKFVRWVEMRYGGKPSREPLQFRKAWERLEAEGRRRGGAYPSAWKHWVKYPQEPPRHAP